MTTEEKAKAYDEALGRAKEFHHPQSTTIRGIVEKIFPELRESEDERIRKWIISQMQMFHEQANTEGNWEDFKMTDAAIYWLEKQKESLHISESCKENAEYFTSQCGDNRFELIDKAKRDIIAKTNIESSPDEMKVLYSFLFRAWQMGWLGKYDVIVPEQKSAWSKEDEKMLAGIIERGSSQVPPYSKALREEQVEWLMNKLKSLRPSWKPSEEQMRALQNAVALTACDKELTRLYNQLKKL